MNLFLDTNVIVGYSIECDPWNYYSKRLFDKFDSFYWSSTVEEETNCVIDKLLYFYSVFFDKVKDRLNQFEFNKSEFFKIFESVTHVDGKKYHLNNEIYRVWFGKRVDGILKFLQVLFVIL